MQKSKKIENEPAIDSLAEITRTSNPGIISLFKCKCPRCREGDMFLEKNPYNLKSFMKMPEKCQVCKQPLELEVGFYYGSAYVSYALTVALSAFTFVLWWLVIGFSLDDNRVFYWLITNAVILILIQPYLMRFARALWLSFFVSYNKNWRELEPVQPERTNEAQKNAW